MFENNYCEKCVQTLLNTAFYASPIIVRVQGFVIGMKFKSHDIWICSYFDFITDFDSLADSAYSENWHQFRFERSESEKP